MSCISGAECAQNHELKRSELGGSRHGTARVGDSPTCLEGLGGARFAQYSFVSISPFPLFNCRSAAYPSPMNKQSGFTLIELMVVISILAILLGIGVPSFRATIEGNRITTVANDLVGALQFARSEAVKRGTNVTLCSSSDQATCSGAWADGWVVRNEAAVAPAPVLLRVWPSARQGVAIAVPGAVEFNALGGATNARCFQITLGALQRFVGVGPAGRVASSPLACPA